MEMFKILGHLSIISSFCMHNMSHNSDKFKYIFRYASFPHWIATFLTLRGGVVQATKDSLTEQV